MLIDGEPSFTKMAITPLIMVGFSKFNLVLKLDNEINKCLCAINVCEFAKNAKFVNINTVRILIAHEHLSTYSTLT